MPMRMPGHTATGVAAVKLFQLLKCMIGNHHRDGRRVRSDGNIDYSRCKGCRQPMMRDKGLWRLERRADRLKREG